METKIGLSNQNMAEVAKSLNILLADETILYIKTRNAHWNVEGPDFHTQHLFFESQYDELEGIIDEVAERVRQLGHYAVGTMREYLQLTHLTEMKYGANDSQGIINELLGDHEQIIMHLRGVIGEFSEKYEDEGNSDFVNSLMQKHEKLAWMLRAHLK